MTLTVQKIKALVPGTYAQDHYDEEGLVLRVYPNGRKVWCVIYYERGHKRRQKIGDWPGMGLKAAREARDQVRARAAGRDAITLGQFAVEYLESWAKPNKRSWREDKRMLEKDLLPHLENRPVAQLARRECAAIIDRIRARGAPQAAARTYALLRKILQLSVDRGIRDDNPALRLPVPSSNPRDRVLTKSELAIWWACLETRLSLPRYALEMVLATGQRLGEVLEMEVSDLELIDGVWLIPAKKAKNGHSHTVPLTSWALNLIDRGRQLSAQGVFDTSAENCRHTMAALVDEAGLERATPHDLRRTVATHLGGLGYTRQVQDKILNHVDQSVSAIYDRYSYDREKRGALEEWAEEVRRIINHEHSEGAA